MARPELITAQSQLDSLCETWRKAGVFVFDTEFIRDDTYDAILCLVQVAAADGVVLIDPTGDLDLTRFWELVTDPTILTIVHAGKEDCELCLRRTGQTPRNLFDVQIAAGFVGYTYPLSLARLVEQVLDRRILKAQTLTDWARRPLTDEQLHYAVEDVAHLLPLHKKLSRELERRGRSAWAAEEFARFEDPQTYKPPVTERAVRLKGSSRLDSLGLLVLARLIEWRDEWAATRNRPIRSLIRDDVLVEIARRKPDRASDLEVLRGFPQSRNPKVIQQILDLIEAARKIPRDQWPEAEAPREETGMMKAALDILSAVTRAICDESGVSKDLVGSAQRLRELMDHHAGSADDAAAMPALLRGWRGEFLGRRLVDLLEGRCELHFKGWPRKPKLEIITHPKK